MFADWLHKMWIPLLACLTAAAVLSSCVRKEGMPEALKEEKKEGTEEAVTEKPTAKEQKEETDELSMFIGLGNTNCGYYAKLHDLILENTGIDVKMVYFNTMNTTSAVEDMLDNCDVPADIVATASKLDPELQKKNFLDMLLCTDIADNFSIPRMTSILVDGAAYQIPFTSRLIGIAYNKTLFSEQGWELPSSLEDMKALKGEAEKAGYKFAVSGGVATGHGMNYLLNVMGSDFLSGPEGYEWINDFTTGKRDVSLFREASGYFREYADSGLFGSYHTQDWLAAKEFSRERALFYYNTINDVKPYDGFRYNEDGTIFGAEYTADGSPVVQEKDDGQAVFLDGEYVYYEADNEKHAGLERYNIPGAVVLHDEYASMPWIGEQGDGNCFINYDNMYLSLDKKLADDEEKLEKAKKVITFMASEEANSLFCSLLSDGFINSKNFKVDDSRLYSEFKDQIQQGYLMDWWYNYFDMDTIVNVGGKVNEYIIGESGVTMDDIMDELERSNMANLNKTDEILGAADETLSYRENALFQAVVSGQNLQKVLDEAGEDVQVTAALMPYMEKLGDLREEKNLGIVQSIIYKGDILGSTLNMYVSTKGGSPLAVKMTGAEIQELVGTGFNAVDELERDQFFPYCLATKDGKEIQDSEEYVVAVCQDSLTNELYEKLLSEGRVIIGSDDVPYKGSTLEGIREYLHKNGEIVSGKIMWQ